MRRLIVEEPIAPSALWSRKLAVFALVVAALAAVLSRSDAIEATVAVTTLGAALFLAGVALLLAAAAGVVIWRSGQRGTGEALSGALLAIALLAWPLILAVQAARLPILADVSTDIADPPAFSRSQRALAARGGFLPPNVEPTARQEQRRAYPGAQPILLDIEPADAWQLVLNAVTAVGWRIIEQAAPGGRAGLAHIDAIDRSLVFGFPNDITIRLRPLASQTRIDIRSVSRLGRHDFGANAARIARFAAELQNQLDLK